MSLLDRFKQFQAEKEQVKPVVSADTEKVMLIDGLNAYLRCFAATPTMNDDGQHVGGITGFLQSVGAAIRLFKPSRVVVVFDGVGGSQRRRKLFPEYKAHRRNMTKLNRTYDFASLEEEKEAQKWQLLVLVGILRCLPITVITIDLVEADDTIAYLAQTVQERGGKATIVSTDKDFLQLVNEDISVWNPIKKKMYTPERVVEDYEFHPNNFLLYRVVTGDDSDGIPGVNGIKEKTLLKFFPELAQSEKKTIEFLLESAEKQAAEKKKPPVALTTFLASKELLLRNIRLMRLDDVAMSGNTRVDVLDKYAKEPNAYNKLELTKLFQSHKLMNAFPSFETWLQTTFVPLMRYKIGK